MSIEHAPMSEESQRDVDLEALFVALKEIAGISREAGKILDRFRDSEPKVGEILDTPQSPDKHAEGPRVEDHYRSILSAIISLRDGKLPFEKAAEFLPVAGFREEWECIEQIAKKRPNLLVAFAFLHDVAKPDTIGFRVGDKSPALTIMTNVAGKEGEEPTPVPLFMDAATDKAFEKRRDTARKAGGEEYAKFKAAESVLRAERLKEYDKLMAAFTAENPGLDPKALQTAFFQKYKISVSYRGHADQAYKGENLKVVERMTAELGLSDEDKAILKFAIEQHINPLMKFTRAEPADYEFFVQKASEAGIDPDEAIRVLQSGLLVDGVLGTLKIPTKEEPRIINADPLTNFWKAQRGFPEFDQRRTEAAERRVREQGERDALNASLAKHGLDGDGLIAAGIARGEGFGAIQAKVVLAAKTGLLGELPGVGETVIAEIERRVKAYRKEFGPKDSSE